MTGYKGVARRVLVDAGVEVRDDGVVEITYRLFDGTVARIQLVAPSGKRWWGPGDGIHLFGAETLAWANPREPVFVCEGVSDALSTRQEFELAAAVAAPGASIWRPEWRALLEPFALIYVIGDGDDAGREFVWRVRRSLPWARAVVMPEGRDLRDLLQAGEAELVAKLCADAERMAHLETVVQQAPDLDTARQLIRGGAPC